jgi:predicted secreted protein
MAIKNASDLLVYKKSTSNVKELTKIYIEGTPCDASGNVVFGNLVDASNNSVSNLTVNINGGAASSAETFLNTIRTALNSLDGYTASTSAVADGDGFSFSLENTFTGDLVNTISLSDGTSVINDTLEIIVTRSGETNNQYEPVAHSTSASFSISQDYRDITTKDSGGFQENASGLRSFEISTDALQDYTADLDFQELFNNVGNRESMTVRFAERDTGGSSDKYYEGTVFVTSLSMDAGVEDNATYSVTFTGTASITSGTD